MEDSQPAIRSGWWRRAGALFLLWTFVGLCFAAHDFLNLALGGKEGTLAEMLSWELVGWYLWGALSLAISWLTHRYPLDRKVWFPHLLLHIAASAVFATIHLGLHATVLQVFEGWIYPPGYLSKNFQEYVFGRIAWRIMVYFIILIACHALELQQRFQEEQQRAAQLESQLANAQLQALKMQVHPHFLFNTLHSISELMHQDLRTADNMMVRLADFLRLTLDNSGALEVSLEKELQFLEGYLEIEQIRFRDRLQVSISVDPEVRKAQVPNLILQPIVENAIRHGIAQRSTPGRIEIRGSRTNGILRVQVRDNGPGLELQQDPESYLRRGLGLSNTKNRLQHLYGRNHTFDLTNAPEGGLVVTLEIPLSQA